MAMPQTLGAGQAYAANMPIQTERDLEGLCNRITAAVEFLNGQLTTLDSVADSLYGGRPQTAEKNVSPLCPAGDVARLGAAVASLDAAVSRSQDVVQRFSRL